METYQLTTGIIVKPKEKLKFDEKGNTVCDGIISNFQKPNKEGYTQINAKNIAFNVKNIVLSWEE